MSRRQLEEPTRYSHSPGFFVARRLSDQTIPSGGGQTLIYDTSVINDNGCFDFGSSTFVCPKAGRMFIGAVVVFDTFATNVTSDALLELNASPNSGLKGNGAIVDRAVLAAGGYSILKGNIIATVQSGSVVRSVGYAFNGANKTNASIFGGESVYFYGYYIV